MATITGTAGNDSLAGTSSADSITGSAGNDSIDGLGGNDTAHGGSGDDNVRGGGGSDLLRGNGGADILNGGLGVDNLGGGSDADIFAFSDFGAANADSITDFVSGEDVIQLDGTLFTGIGASGFFVANSSGTAQDADDRIIFETDTRQVWYDADGTGAGARQLIATLQVGGTLVATDITVLGGTPSGNVINGTEGNDTLNGTEADETINGLGGNDLLLGERGSDEMYGGAGNDTLQGGLDKMFSDFDEADTLSGGQGNDEYRVDHAADFLIEEGGVDTVVASDMSWTLAAGFENLLLQNSFSEAPFTGIGNSANNFMEIAYAGGRLEGLGGNDTLIGAGGEGQTSTLLGGDGDDSIVGSSDLDVIDGGAGSDTLSGGAFDDTGDTLTGGAGGDSFMLAQFPNDFAAAAETITDFASGVDGMHVDARFMPELGASGTLVAGDGRFHAAAGAAEGHDADDRLVYDTSSGRLYFDADGSGADTAVVIATLTGVPALAATDITIDNGATVINGTTGADSLEGTTGHDSIEGLGGADTVDGGAGNDTLRGGGGSDVLRGDPGADLLNGGLGTDNLNGGSEADIFAFSDLGAANADSIGDFVSGGDTLQLDGSIFTAAGADGRFVAGDARFAANASGTAQDGSDRIIFETDTGQLWYDADGTGAGARQLIATVQAGGTVVASDISVINGSTGGGQVINGTSGNDVLTGTEGDDTINGLGGHDSLDGAQGADQLNGGDGNDTLNGSAAGETDTLSGGLGDDVFRIDSTSDSLSDAGGADTVVAVELSGWTLGAGFENLHFLSHLASVGIGNELDNGMISGLGGGRLEGRAGNDTLTAGMGAAELLGEDGNDVLQGDWSDDTLDGGVGNDTLAGGSMFDRLTGGGGADTFLLDSRGVDDDGWPHPSWDTIADFASGTDRIWLDAAATGMSELGASGTLAAGDPRFHAAAGATAGHDADDRLVYDTATGTLYFDPDGSGAEGAEIILVLGGGTALAANDISILNGTASAPVINGTAGNDAISGTAASETINALAGNDTIAASAGNDTINGGDGRDSIEFKSAATSGVAVDWVAGSIVSGSGTITFTSIERVAGGNFGDSMAGNAAAQNLTGQGGSDTLWGANGADTLWGNSGGDFFVFREMGTANADRISDFVTGADEIQLDGSVFTGIGSGFFVANASGTAQDAGDRVVYNTETGQLYYDADGSGGGGAQLIATLVNDPTLVASDISVI